MLRKGCSGMQLVGVQQLDQVSMYACRLRAHAGGQRMHDSVLRQEPAEVAVIAGDSDQQRCQHAGYGVAGPRVVCRAHNCALGSWPGTGHHWAAADQQGSHHHCSLPAAHRGGSRQQQARSGSCQEEFVRFSQRRRGAATQVVPKGAGTAVSAAAAALGSAAGNSGPSLHMAAVKGSAALSSPSLEGQPLTTAGTADSSMGSSCQGPGGRLTGCLLDSLGSVGIFGAVPDDRSSSSSSSSGGGNGGSSSDNGADRAVASKRLITPQLGRLSYRMLVSYDGTAYSGWQLQSGSRTIQGEIERALTTVLREDRAALCICAAGRTDAGVHAVGQVVQFMTNVTTIDPDRLPYKLNSLLPHDIRICWMHQTAPDFNVTVSANHKTYHYNLDTGPAHDPLRIRYSHHVRHQLDLDAMQAAASLLVGTHDFTQLSNDSAERLRRNPVKTLLRFDVVQAAPNSVRLEVQGTGFLYKQVRHMTGLLLAVGQDKLGLEHVQHLLDIGSSQPPGAGGLWRGYNVAPAKGLQLYHVDYPAGADDPGTLLYPGFEHDEYGRLLSRIPGASSVDEE